MLAARSSVFCGRTRTGYSFLLLLCADPPPEAFVSLLNMFSASTLNICTISIAGAPEALSVRVRAVLLKQEYICCIRQSRAIGWGPYHNTRQWCMFGWMFRAPLVFINMICALGVMQGRASPNSALLWLAPDFVGFFVCLFQGPSFCTFDLF